MFNIIKTAFNGLVYKIKELIFIKKDDLKEVLDNEVTMLQFEILPSLKSCVYEVDGGILDRKVIENDVILKDIRENLDRKVRNNTDLLALLIDIIGNIDEFHLKFNALIMKYFPNKTTDNTITLRELGVFKVVNDIVAFRSYLSDLMIYIIACYSRTDFTMFKRSVERLNRGTVNFANTIDNLTKPSLEFILKSIPEMGSENVKELIGTGDVVDGFIPQIKDSDKNGMFLKRGFIGNPIYHFRIWMEDREHRVYEANKVKRQTFELILLDLKKQSQGEVDPSLEKQIKYYENKIYQIENKLAKYEMGR